MESNAVLLPSPQHMSQAFAGLPDRFLNQQHTIDSMLLQQTRRRKILWECCSAVIEAFRSWSRSASIPANHPEEKPDTYSPRSSTSAKIDAPMHSQRIVCRISTAICLCAVNSMFISKFLLSSPQNVGPGRFPLSWNELRAELPVWREMLRSCAAWKCGGVDSFRRSNKNIYAVRFRIAIRIQRFAEFFSWRET
jgi:hypothetical protein